ncbi:MAG: hypothetical protein DCC75_07575 [Proteobacteria bacterium]|nr:MAG: hypothetical protein DCC75_07575 [Pseudomonadota bacterium]
MARSIYFKRLLVLGTALLCSLYSPFKGFAAEQGIAPRTEDESRTIQIYRSAGEAVVFITTITLTVDPFDIFPEIQPREGSGSGIIVDSAKGIILTNLHVIQDAQKIEISLADGQTYPARLVGFDQEYDIAVLQLKQSPAKLTSVPFGDSSKLEVGQRVLAIGNPFGLDRTLTAGIVSSLNRTVKGKGGHLMRGLIQTDAAINPGNSGGPLLDMNGDLVGINSAILSQSGDSAGIGFAVPINQIKRVLPELIATGKVLRPKVGWVLVDTNQGPMVRRIAEGSPADQAGLQAIERMVSNAFLRGYVQDVSRADLILKVNGKRVYSKDEVDEAVISTPTGKVLELVLRRGGIKGRERTVTIVPELG